MKQSLYTSIIPITDTLGLIYNALTDRFVVVNNPEIVASKSLPLHSILKESELYSQLKDTGMIVPKEKDEVAEIEEIIRMVDNDNSAWSLHINPTLDCNFRCWYCYESHIPGSKMQPDTLKALKLLINNVLEPGKKNLKNFYLSFFGGEPLIGFNQVARPLIEEASAKCKEVGVNLHIHFTTNGYLLTPEIIDFLSQYNCGLQITFDGGPEAHDTVRYPYGGGKSYHKILSNLLSASEKGIDITLRVNYTSENLHSVHALVSDLENYSGKGQAKISINFQRVWQDRSKSNEPEVIEVLESYSSRLKNAGYRVSSHSALKMGVKFSCYGDKRNYALINYNGDVFQCTARDFKPENRSGRLLPDGTIEWDEEKVSRRRCAKFSKPICKTCRIAPLCGGGCRTSAVERASIEGCSYQYSEDDIDSMIMDRFTFFHMSHKN